MEERNKLKSKDSEPAERESAVAASRSEEVEIDEKDWMRGESRAEEVLEVVDADGGITLVELPPVSRSKKQDESAA